MDVPRRWMFLDPTALLCKALPTAVTAMVAEEEEEAAVVVAASGELLVVMEVSDLLVVEVEVVDLEEVAGTLVVVAAAEEATGHATTVVKEATLPEIALMNPLNVMEGRVVVVRATATIVGSLVILQGIAAPQQQPVLRKKKKMEKQSGFHSLKRRKCFFFFFFFLFGGRSGVVGWGKRLCSLSLFGKD